MIPTEEGILGMIREIVQEETVYLKHYNAEIADNNDPLMKGRVKVLVYELGFTDPGSAIWANPRQNNSMIIPRIGQWVEVYFINGDPGNPVYLPLASEVAEGLPQSYDGQIGNNLIFESPISATNNIKFDNNAQLLTLLSGTQSFVLGENLMTWINNLINTTFNTHTHLSSAPGNPSSPPTPLGVAPTNILSMNIKGK